MDREYRIDIMRGLAMITIAINHTVFLLSSLGYRGPHIPTLTAFGFSSAAEIFFILSGYMVGLVYFNKPNLTTKVFSRAAKIYAFNVSGFISVLILSFFLPAQVIVATDLDYTSRNLFYASLMFLAFLQHPYLLGVLQLYVLLMLCTPLAVALLKRHKSTFIVLSATLFLATKWSPDFNLPGGSPEGDWLWNFNPFAWQFLYFIGVILGRNKYHKTLFTWLDHSLKRQLIVFLIFAVIAIVFRQQVTSALSTAFVSRTNLGILNLMHTFVGIATVAVLASLFQRHIRWLASSLATIGKNTLECYVASVPLTYAVAALWLQLPNNLLSFLFANIFVIINIYLIALIKNRFSNGNASSTIKNSTK